MSACAVQTMSLSLLSGRILTTCFAGLTLKTVGSSALLGVYLKVSIKNSAGNFCRFGTRTLQSYGLSAYQRALDD
jgi:hypothetical protein